MMRKILRCLVNKETILYLVFGVMTTVVNFGSFILFDWIFGNKYYLVSNVFSFVMATVFAFVTNKQFVFKSKVWTSGTLVAEMISFASARIGTFLIVEEMGLWIAVQCIGIGKLQLFCVNGILMAKVCLAFLAVLINYILSKCWIFKQNK